MTTAQIRIVDDEPHIRRLLEAAVARAGHRTLVAASGRAAIRLAETHAPDGALADLGLADRDGIELVERFARRGIAVIVVPARNAGRVGAHAKLLKSQWGPAHANDVEYLRVAVRAIRRKREVDPTKPQLIRNEPGIGYRLMLT